MKIGSRIHPRERDQRRVTIHGREYIFAKTEDKFGDTHFVADVKNEEHAAVLVGSDDFYPYNADMAPAPALQPPKPAVDPTEVVPPPAVDAAIQAEAEALLAGSASTISSAVGAVSSLAVVETALANEQAKKQPRTTVVKLLEATLEGAKAAGVTA